MTETQKQVMEKVQDLLCEHFEAYVVSLSFEDTKDNDTKLFCSKGVYWHGGAVHALGCAEYAKQVLIRQAFESPEEDL